MSSHDDDDENGRGIERGAVDIFHAHFEWREIYIQIIQSVKKSLSSTVCDRSIRMEVNANESRKKELDWQWNSGIQVHTSGKLWIWQNIAVKWSFKL